jgi:hypothetical protein
MAERLRKQFVIRSEGARTECYMSFMILAMHMEAAYKGKKASILELTLKLDHFPKGSW